MMRRALRTDPANREAKIIYGGADQGGCYVRAGLGARPGPDMPILQEEVFAPILYLIEFDTLDQVDRLAQRRAAGLVVGHVHHQHDRGGDLPERAG